MASRSRELIGHCRYPRSAKSITSAGKRKPRNARAVVMDGILGRVMAGVPLLHGHAAPLNATEPSFEICFGARLSRWSRRLPVPTAFFEIRYPAAGPIGRGGELQCNPGRVTEIG